VLKIEVNETAFVIVDKLSVRFIHYILESDFLANIIENSIVSLLLFLTEKSRIVTLSMSYFIKRIYLYYLVVLTC
jgi:hypothetical protein